MLAIIAGGTAYALTNNADPTQTSTAASPQTTTPPETTSAPATTTTAPTTTVALATTTTAPTTTAAPATTIAAPETTSAPATTTAAPAAARRCPGDGHTGRGLMIWYQPHGVSAAPGETMLIEMCGEDPAGLNFLKVDLDIDCQAGSQLTSGDLSNAADPTYYYARFTCIVPPDQAPGQYSMRTEINGAGGSPGLSVYATVTGTATTPTTTTTLPDTGTGGDSSPPSISGLSYPTSVDSGGTVRVTGTATDPTGISSLYMNVSGLTCQDGSNRSADTANNPTTVNFDLTCIIHPDQPAGEYSALLVADDPLQNRSMPTWVLNVSP